MKTALLIPYTDKNSQEGYVWMTPSDIILSQDFETREEVLNNRPDPEIYICRDDGYNKI